ncbi:MAG: carboxypeptidase-like regulatory domain-containing protein [Acidobacteria bacterium]|nr:carboxypeptidase-like regulatory domain-containing protein [Acidobacteriota bacterium]
MRRRFAAVVVGLLMVITLTAAPKKRKKNEPLALISGTVFQSSGFLLRGAKVVAVSEQERKIKIESQTGERGEFALRVPVAKGPYVVTAEARGFEAQQRTAEVYESQKTTVTFQLKPKQ